MLYLVDLLTCFQGISDEDVARVKREVRNLLLPHLPGFPVQFKVGVAGYQLCLTINPDDRYYVDLTAEGLLNRVVRLAAVDLDPIRKACLLQEFPCPTPIGIINYSEEGVPRLDEEPLTVQFLHGKPNKAHTPFCLDTGTSYWRGDRWLRLPHYDTVNQLAFLVNRYCQGMNVGVAFLDLQQRVLRCWSFYNYDYPCGVAIRLQAGQVQIYLDSNEQVRQVLYQDPLRKPLTVFENSSPGNQWCSLLVERSFAALRTFQQYCHEHPDVTVGYNELVEERNTEFERVLFEERNWTRAAKLGEELLHIPGLETRYGFLTTYSDATRIRYNLACCYARLKQGDKAMALLHVIAPYWKQWDRVAIDPYLAILHEREDWQALLAAHSG